MPKVNGLTEGTLVALKAVRQNDGATLAELIDAGFPVSAAHMTSLKRHGLVTTEQVEVPVTRMTLVNKYILTEAGTDYVDPSETADIAE
jgi:hypothetical protein